MDCPKCRKAVKDSDSNCPYCGTPLRQQGDDKAKKKRVRAKVKAIEDTSNAKKARKRRLLFKKSEAAEKKSPPWLKLRIAAIAACVLVVIITIAAVVSIMLSSQGEKYAEAAAEYIGTDPSVLSSEEDLHFADDSDFYGVNSVIDFDYVLESDKTVTSEGIKYPRWAVFLKTSEAGFITDVTYTNFAVIKGDVRGKKHDSLIDLDSLQRGDKQTSVLRDIDIDPYSITYSQSGITVYTYRYYYERENGDEQQIILRVGFDEDGGYRYHSSEIVFPNL